VAALLEHGLIPPVPAPSAPSATPSEAVAGITAD